MSKATGFGIGVCLCLGIRASDEGRAEDSGPRSVTHLGKKAQKPHYENCTHAINSNIIHCYIYFPTSHQLNIFGWLIKNKIQVAINANSFTEFRLITVKTSLRTEFLHNICIKLEQHSWQSACLLCRRTGFKSWCGNNSFFLSCFPSANFPRNELKLN